MENKNISWYTLFLAVLLLINSLSLLFSILNYNLNVEPTPISGDYVEFITTIDNNCIAKGYNTLTYYDNSCNMIIQELGSGFTQDKEYGTWWDRVAYYKINDMLYSICNRNGVVTGLDIVLKNGYTFTIQDDNRLCG